MEFNDVSNGTGVCQEIDDICNSDSNSYPLKSKTRRVNQAIDRFLTLAFKADGRWAWTDPNLDAAPIYTINLVSGTQSYNLDDFTSEIINILRVEILDSNGTSRQLSRLKREDISQGLPSYQNTSGTPKEYDLVGEFIYLYPKPNYNSTNGLRLYIETGKSEFEYTDTTKVLPVPSLFEAYICRLASLPYLIDYQKPQKSDVASLIEKDEEKIKEYFFSREESVPKGMKPRVESCR